MQNLTLYITGASGFLGQHFLKDVVDRGHTVFALERSASDSKDRLPKAINWIQGTLDTFQPIATGSQSDNRFSLVHLASYGVSPKKCTWEEAVDINVTQSFQLIRRFFVAGAERVVIAGSGHEFGTTGDKYEQIPEDAALEPVGPYGATKAALSLLAAGLAREENRRLMIVRLFNLFGDGQDKRSFWGQLTRACQSGENFQMSNGYQVRDFSRVENAAEFLADSLTKPISKGHPVFVNHGSGSHMNLADFAKYWWQRLDAKGELEIGAIPDRENEIKRLVPKIKER